MSVVVAVCSLGAAAVLAGGVIVVLSPRRLAGGTLPEGYRLPPRPTGPHPAPAAAKERWTPDVRYAHVPDDEAPPAVDRIRPYALLTPATRRHRARHAADDLHAPTVPIPTRVPAEEMTC